MENCPKCLHPIREHAFSSGCIEAGCRCREGVKTIYEARIEELEKEIVDLKHALFLQEYR